jgi:hypothetical protein
MWRGPHQYPPGSWPPAGGLVQRPGLAQWVGRPGVVCAVLPAAVLAALAGAVGVFGGLLGQPGSCSLCECR